MTLDEKSIELFRKLFTVSWDVVRLREAGNECLDAIAELQRGAACLRSLLDAADRTKKHLRADNAALRARLAELERPVVVDTTNQGE